MKKVRLVLLASLAVAIVAIVVLFKIPINGWMVWIQRAIMIIAASFAVSVTALFLATLFRTNGKNLWNTGYFRYMRAFWGESWGGRRWSKQPLQISTCRATWLSLFALWPWILLIGMGSYIAYFFVAGTLQGFEQVSFLWNQKKDLATNLFSNLFVFGFLGTFWILGPLAIVGLRDSFKRQLPKFHRAIKWAYIVFAAIVLCFSLIVVPVKYAGLGDYLRVAGGILGGAVIGAGVVYGVWLLCTRTVPKLREFFEKETVPGALISAQHKGWKQKVCPLIIQTMDEEK